MTKDAKQAAKLEKKLKILLGGYQVKVEKSLMLLCGDILLPKKIFSMVQFILEGFPSIKI